MSRRKGADGSAVRQTIIERTIAIVDAEGYSAVTAGRIARELSLTRHSIHYYFGTIDELFVAVMRHEGEKAKSYYDEILASDNPLRLIWEHPGQSGPKTFETILLALKSDSIRAEVRRSTEILRDTFTKAIEKHLAARGMRTTCPPVAIGMIILGMSRMLRESAALGVEAGQEQTRQLLEDWIRQFDIIGEWPSIA